MQTVRGHWPEDLIEAAGLGFFMLSACGFATLVGHPASPVARAVSDALLRRALIGVAMGLTAIALIYSPWDRRSGAHFNPATTLTFWRLGKLATADGMLYAVAQTLGGLAGVALAALALGSRIADPAVRYVTTLPGPRGAVVAFNRGVRHDLRPHDGRAAPLEQPAAQPSDGLAARALVAASAYFAKAKLDRRHK